MVKQIDLTAPKVQERQRQVGTYGTQTPLASTAVERGSTRWLNGSSVAIEGQLNVSGTLSGGGDFEWSGSFTQSGPTTFTGEVDLNGPVTVAGDITSTGTFTQTGPTHLNGETTVAGDTTVTGKFDVDGPMTTTGTLSVEGVTTLKNDLNVTTGKIKIGTSMTLDPSVSGGSIAFAGGGGLQGASGVTVMKGSGNAGFLAGETTSMFTGPNSVDVGNTYVTINGPLRNNGMPTTSNAANVHYDPSTQQFYYKP